MNRMCLLVMGTVILCGCAVTRPGGFNGSYHSSTANADKVGEASAVSILRLLSFGDCSIDAAMKNGGMAYVRNIDQRDMSLLGIFEQTTTIAYGSNEQPYRARPAAAPVLPAVQEARPVTTAPAPMPLSPATLYFVREGNNIWGPAPLETIREWLAQRRIADTAELRSQQSNDWVPVNAFIAATQVER